MADVICQGCEGCNAFVTDVIVTYIAVADVKPHYLDISQLYIVTDGMSHMFGWCYCHYGWCYCHSIIGWFYDHVTDGIPHVWQLIWCECGRWNGHLIVGWCYCHGRWNSHMGWNGLWQMLLPLWQMLYHWVIISVWVLCCWLEPHPKCEADGTCLYFCSGMDYWPLWTLILWSA